MSDRTIGENCGGRPSRQLVARFGLLSTLVVLSCCTASLYAAPLDTGATAPLSSVEAIERLTSDAQPPSGIYALESGFTFNTLDAVGYDTNTRRISLMGHYDPRFIGPTIPFLQYLAALLETGQPHFSLETTAASQQAIRNRLASTPYSRDAILAHFSDIFDEQGAITWFGRSILTSLGLSPIKGHRRPGFFGAAVQALPSGAVRVKSILAGSPADDANLKAGDEITRFDGQSPSSAAGFDRLVRFAGGGGTVAISYVRNGQPRNVSVVLIPDPDPDPWRLVRQADVDALLPSATQGKPTVKRLRELAMGSPMGFQIPPELMQRLLGAQLESTPVYFGEAANSQLSRLMFEADYAVIKRLGHRVDLKDRIPGYQTWFDYAASHPGSRHVDGGKRIWITVAKMDVVQSPSGRTLEFRGVRMRFNIRNQGPNGQDVPTSAESQGYADILTARFDALAEEYFALHELREAAKLAAAARWIHQKTPGLRLPAQGRVVWHGPAKVPGMIFMQVSKSGGTSWLVAHGGVDISPPDRILVVPMDRGAPDPTAVAARSGVGRDAIGTGYGVSAQPPPPAGSIGKVKLGERRLDAATVALPQASGDLEVLRDGLNEKVVPKAAVDQDDQKLRRAIAQENDPVHKAGDMLQLAWSLHEQGKDGEAIALYKQAQSLAPNHPTALLLQAMTQAESGDRHGAIETLKQYTTRDPQNGAAKAALVRLQTEEKDGIVKPPPPGGSVTVRLGGVPPEQAGLTPLPLNGSPPSAAPSETALSGGQPRSNKAMRQLADAARRLGAAARTAEGDQFNEAVARAGDPCFSGSRGGCDAPVPQTVSVPIPKPKPDAAQKPAVRTLLDQRNQIVENRIELQRQLNDLNAKPGSLSPDDQQHKNQLLQQFTSNEQEAQKIETEIQTKGGDFVPPDQGGPPVEKTEPPAEKTETEVHME